MVIEKGWDQMLHKNNLTITNKLINQLNAELRSINENEFLGLIVYGIVENTITKLNNSIKSYNFNNS